MPNEGQALEMFTMIGGIAAAAGLTTRLGQQTHPFVCADGLDIDAGTLRETGDRGGGKGWHGAGVAFGVTIKPFRAGTLWYLRMRKTWKKASLCISTGYLHSRAP